MEQGNKYHYLIASLLGVAGLMILLIFIVVRSQADEITTTTTISNSTPTIDTDINIGTSGATTSYNGSAVNLDTNAGTFEIWVSGTGVDLNTCQELTAGDVNATLYLTANGSACPVYDDTSPSGLDDEDCYYTACTITDCADSSDTTFGYYCAFDVYHHADPGSWTASVSAIDSSSGLVIATSTNTMTVNEQTSMNLNISALSFGTLALGADSADQTLTVSNYANDEDMDLSLSAADLGCSTLGTIASTQVRYATETSQTFLNHPATLNNASTTYDLSIGRGTQANRTQPTGVNFMLRVPSSGVRGTCTGTIELIAS